MQIEDLLGRHGLRLLGVAHTAFAVEVPGHGVEAFKIGFDVEDGWPDWAAWCAGQSCTHLPRVRFCRWIESASGRRVMFVAQVERLMPSIVGRRWIKAAPALKRDPLGLADFVEVDHPAIAALLRDAADAFPRGHWDMGGPNWLERPDGTVVLNDPLSRADVDAAPAARAA